MPQKIRQQSIPKHRLAYIQLKNREQENQVVVRLVLRQNQDWHIKTVSVTNQQRNKLKPTEIEEFHYLPLVLEEDDEEITTDYLFEPSKDAVVTSLIPRHLNVQMWRFLLESNASEQAARMTSMEAATENAGDLIDRLRLEYNKARQAAITTEILEVVSGAEALVE